MYIEVERRTDAAECSIYINGNAKLQSTYDTCLYLGNYFRHGTRPEQHGRDTARHRPHSCIDSLLRVRVPGTAAFYGYVHGP